MAPVFDTPLFSSDQSIDRVLNTGLPVVLVFLDDAQSGQLYNTLKSLAKQEAGNLLVVQLSPKDGAQTAQRFGIHASPAVVAVKNGQAHSKAEGISAAQLEQHARFLLGKGPRPEDTPSAFPAGGQPGRPVTVTDATFDQEVLRSAVPVIVDFWAPWCGPCRMVAPILDKLAGEWAGKVKIAKINVDENPRVAGQHGVQAIPTMMVVRDGRVVDQWAGALPEHSMRSRLSRIIR